MLDINRINKRKKDVSSGSDQERSNPCVASSLAKNLCQLISTVVIVHLLGTLMIALIFVVTDDVEVERLDHALEALTSSANRLYALILTLATPVTLYSSKKSAKSE